MKLKFSILFALFITLIGCNNDDDDTLQADLNGDYVGYFERNGTSSKVQLTLKNGVFEGQSEITKFPAICQGTYDISGDKINFQNTCPWTAEFDWSLILSKDWNFIYEKNILTMTRINGDKYVLTK